MSRYTDRIADRNNHPIVGALVYVYTEDGDLEALTDDDALPMANPVKTDEFGNFYFNTSDGMKTIDVWFGGYRRWSEAILVGPQLTGPKGDPGFDGASGVSAVAIGAVGDGVTDDHTALQAWLDLGGDLYLPAGQFYSSQTLIVRKQVRVRGAGYGFDARSAGYENMPGSRIRFPAGVAGLDVQPQTTIKDVATVLADIPAAFTQEGAYGSTFADFALIGANAGAAVTGFFNRTVIQVKNVYTVQFAGKGFDISATSDLPDGNDYGNASCSSLRDCVALDNGGHGFHLRGRDANTILVENCNARDNGGRGFLEEGLLGNSYIKNHAAGNLGGSYKSIGAVNESTYDFNYVEGDVYAGAVINSLNKIRGGGLEGVNVPTDFAPWSVGGYLQKAHEIRYYWGFTDPAPIVGYGRQFRSVINGMVIQGEGGAFDVSLYNKAGQGALRIPTGTQNVYAEGSVSGNGLVTRDGYLKRTDGNQILHSPVAGETNFFAVGTGIYRWFNAANAQSASMDGAGNWNYTGNLALAAATQISMGGVKIIGAQGAAVADAAALTSVNANPSAAAPTKAEFDAFVAEFNKLRTDLGATRTQLNLALARLRAATGHGLIA